MSRMYSGRKIYDISMPLTESLASWPGDIPFTRTIGNRISQGSTINLSAISMSVHMGTHADAPNHFMEGGATVDAIDPSVFIGPALVVDVRGQDRVSAAVFQSLDLAGSPRVLLKTGSWTDHTRFPTSIPVLDEDVPQHLAERGVVLIGVDIPSVDPLDSKTLSIHHKLGAAGIHILECLDIADVSAGRYELIALPLRIEGADGSPVRAILIETVALSSL